MSKYVLRLEVQDGVGTGFLFGYNRDRSLAAIATAAHVIGHAHRWRQPLRLVHPSSGQEVFLPFTERVVFLDQRRDSASILVRADALEFEAQSLLLMDPAKYKKVGVEIAWMGFPSVAYPELCFFTGCVSAFIEDDEYYLIDGVAINGVSGGPVFAAVKETEPEIIGIVSAYLPNRTGNTPGLLRAQDISAFHRDLQRVHDFDDAKEKEREASQKATLEGEQGPESEKPQQEEPQQEEHAAPEPAG